MSSQVECQRYDNILGTQNVSISPNTSVFIKNGIVCANTRHDNTVLTSSYVTLTDEEYLRMTEQRSEEGMNKCVFIFMMEMHQVHNNLPFMIFCLCTSFFHRTT